MVIIEVLTYALELIKHMNAYSNVIWQCRDNDLNLFNYLNLEFNFFIFIEKKSIYIHKMDMFETEYITASKIKDRKTCK